jgi:hypothetical protein
MPLDNDEPGKLVRLAHEARRADRIEKAKLSLEEETREDIVEHAKHVLIEEELAERIDKTADTLEEMKQELRDFKKKHRAIVKKIRQELGVRRPVSTEERAKRRERARRVEEYRARTIELIREIEKEHRASGDEELFDILPPHEAIMASQMTYTELANLLNERKHSTTFDGERKWTRLSVKRIIEQHGNELQRIGHIKDTLKIANKKRSKAVEDFAIWMRDEVFPSINVDQPYLTIAKELNTRGIKTRTSGEWGNVSVKRLLDKIKELSGE